MKLLHRSLALRIALFYILPSALWIFLSDRMLNLLVAAPTEHTWLETGKGWGFVLFSGSIIYAIMRSAARRQEQARQEQAQVNQELEQANRELEMHIFQQEAVATLRRDALAGTESVTLMQRAVRLVTLALDTEYSSVLELLPDGQSLVLRAGKGWPEGLIDNATAPAHSGTLVHQILESLEPVTAEDLPHDPRFTIPSPLLDYGVVSSINMVISGRDQPFGILGAHSPHQRTFTDHDHRFMRAIASVLSTAIGRERAEAEVRRQKTLLECQSEASPDGILVIGSDGQVLSYNQHFLEMWHIPQEVMIAHRHDHVGLLDSVLDQMEDPEAFKNRIDYLYEHPEATNHDEILLKDGRILDRYSAPVQDSASTYYGRVWYYRDVTEVRQAERALQQSHRLLRNVLTALDESVIVVNPYTRQIQDCNQRTETMFGYSREELIGQPTDFLHVSPEMFEQFGRLSLESYARHGFFEVEYSMRRKNGEVFPTEHFVRPMYDEHRQLVNVVSVIRDITQRKQAEEHLRQRNEQLQMLSRRLVEVQERERHAIARELHDEVGQILTGLNLSLEMLERQPAEHVPSRLEQAREMINDLMRIVREMSLQLRPPMLDDLGLLAALLWHIERYTAQTGIQVHFKHIGIDDRRFAPEIEIAVYRMIQEALTNVARYAAVSEVAVRVWAYDTLLGVQVEDQGRGFDPDIALTRHTSTGLAGMQERILLLDGSLSIESAPDQGSCLTMELPLVPPSSPEATESL